MSSAGQALQDDVSYEKSCIIGGHVFTEVMVFLGCNLLFFLNLWVTRNTWYLCRICNLLCSCEFGQLLLFFSPAILHLL